MAQLCQAAREPDFPWGGYKLMLADLGTRQARPVLGNVRDVTPPWRTLVEPGGFAIGKLCFGANDPDNSPSTHLGTGDLDIREMDLASG